jgi:transglutaminase-like putative cysteine protease
MRRTALLYAVPAALLVADWLRLEERPVGWRGIWMAILAFLPALARSRRGATMLAVGAFLLAVHSAFSVSLLDARPFDSRHDFFGPLVSRIGDGLGQFYDVQLPFSRAGQPLMDGLVLLAIFSFSLLLSLAIARRRPFLAVLVLIVGGGWPTTLLSGDGDLGRGALLLTGVLWLLVGLHDHRAREVRPALLASGLVVAAALAASTSAAVAKEGFLDWQRWDFYDRPDSPVGVRYVWNSDYNGIRFPKRTTTVLRVRAPATPLYWRATTLDLFSVDRWSESLNLQDLEPAGRHALLGDPPLPPRGRKRSAWVEQQVEIRALEDVHLVGASVPVAYDTPQIGGVQFDQRGVAVAALPPDRESTYRVWSYAPQPTAAQLARSRPAYPLELRLGSHYLTVDRSIGVPPFGTPGRERAMRDFFRGSGRRLRLYRKLYERARTVAGTPRNPYAAVVALESWFRSGGDFRYDEQPPRSRGLPPLVDFVVRTRAGYCQHFAGAMALMLRYLGIPAQVAVGFTAGRYESSKQTWQVTDHDAHAWVEVWFRGYGWLPFDPTPGRGRLGATYTTASAGFDASGVAAALSRTFGAPRSASERLRRLAQLRGERGDDRLGVSGGGSRFRAVERSQSLLRLFALVLLALVAAIALAKFLRRRVRYLSRNPRKVARACRLELVEFLRDQRFELPASATLPELGRIVEAELEVDSRGFVGAATAARFGPPSVAGDAARRARAELRRLRRGVRSRLGNGARLRGLVSLRSFGAA